MHLEIETAALASSRRSFPWPGGARALINAGFWFPVSSFRGLDPWSWDLTGGICGRSRPEWKYRKMQAVPDAPMAEEPCVLSLPHHLPHPPDCSNPDAHALCCRRALTSVTSSVMETRLALISGSGSAGCRVMRLAERQPRPSSSVYALINAFMLEAAPWGALLRSMSP